MVDEGFKRKLAAILSADVEGYSLLMDQDEEGTIRNLKAFRSAMTDLVQQYRGRVIDSPGDNVLAEFTSVVDAVNCAVEVQRDFAERNTELPEDRRMLFRIGVNLGDVVDDAGRIYGDGVNIAARVESMAEAGGICITGRAYDQVANKLGLEYEYLGEHQVKNISTPIRVYRVLSYPGAAAHRVVMAKRATGKKWKRIGLAGVGLIVLAVIAFWGWQYYMGFSRTVEAASIERMKYPLPEKPSIAILPFANLSNNANDEYIADGITDDIITAISRINAMFVIARNSVFVYKNKPAKIKEISEDFGVQYVLEGSIERSGDRLRVTSRLIDALAGNHIWVERYEYMMEDVFTIKDDITKKIITALAIEITDGEKARIFETHTENLEAIIQFSKGTMYFSNWEKMENNLKAREHFEKAVELDPEFIGAVALLANTHYLDWVNYWSTNREDSYSKFVNLVEKAISLDPSSSYAHALQGQLYRWQRHYEEAIAELNLALALDPNNSEYHYSQGRNYHLAKQPEKAIEYTQNSMRLEPYFADSRLVHLGQSFHMAGRYQEALDYYSEYSKRKNQAGEQMPRWVYYSIIIAHLELGQIENAYKYFEEASAMGGHFRYIGWAIGWMGYKKSDRERLRKLFLPLHEMAAKRDLENKK